MPPGGTPAPDFSAILPDDTRLSWLQRTELNNTWTPHPQTGEPIGMSSPEDYPEAGYFFMRISESQFELYKAKLYDRLPPIWPGEGNIVRGDPVPLAQGVVVSVSMDGAELYITATARPIPYVGMDTYHSYRSLGRYAFVNDAGDLEQWSGIPADVCQIMPRQMNHAVGLLLSFYTGVTGTVTPFTVNR